MSEQLCTCGHLTSDHELTVEWTPMLNLQYGSPCNRCQADPRRRPNSVAADMMCTGFEVWPMSEIPWPGTMQAVELGCRCPVRINVERAARRDAPIFTPDCVVHDWICKFVGRCKHGEHSRPHATCEHCTVPQIECSVCAKRWADWRVPPEKCGWVKLSDGTQNLKAVWRCNTCQHQQ